jgi:biotin carboxylase
LIRKSLPEKSFDSLVLSKAEFQEKCLQWGVRVPRNVNIKSVEEALSEARTMGYPVVVKKDSGHGGGGVFICHTETDIINCFHTTFTISPLLSP